MSKPKYCVAYATGSRADYGIVRNYLRHLDKDSEVKLSLLITGALLSDKFGNQVELIYRDGFSVEKEFPVEMHSATNAEVIRNMSETMTQFGNYFETKKHDLLILLGDRYEIFAVATAAAMHNIPILHLHGGEATYYNYDEFLRHAITKMSRYHFTSTEKYRKRVIQLGEHPDRVFNLGALGAENCGEIDENHVPDWVKGLPEREYLVVLFHPETLSDNGLQDQCEELLAALDEMKSFRLFFIGTNADTMSNVIRDRVRLFVEKTERASGIENLHPDAYHYLVKKAACLVGNSSSGLIEAPSLGVYTVNIGHRQDGRERGNSVIDVMWDRKEILTAIQCAVKKNRDMIANPYKGEDTALKYYQTTKTILQEIYSTEKIRPKVFYDL